VGSNPTLSAGWRPQAASGRSAARRFGHAVSPLEESHRGLVGATGNRVCDEHRGFESHLLRHRRARQASRRQTYVRSPFGDTGFRLVLPAPVAIGEVAAERCAPISLPCMQCPCNVGSTPCLPHCAGWASHAGVILCGVSTRRSRLHAFPLKGYSSRTSVPDQTTARVHSRCYNP
jgi:hypothetical protein